MIQLSEKITILSDEFDTINWNNHFELTAYKDDRWYYNWDIQFTRVCYSIDEGVEWRELDTESSNWIIQELMPRLSACIIWDKVDNEKFDLLSEYLEWNYDTYMFESEVIPLFNGLKFAESRWMISLTN